MSAVFEVRRARSHALGQVVFSGALFVAVLWSLIDAYQKDAITGWNPIATAGLFAMLVGFYLWQGVQQFFDRRPVLVVGPDGLFLPAALGTPIPWQRIARADCIVSILRPGRIDIQVEPELYGVMRFGHRILGDNVVRRNAMQHMFAVYMRGYDHSATEIFDAIRQYWPPRGVPT